MLEIVITNNDSGQRFDKYLQKYFSGAPRGFIYKMLRKKNIVLNSGRAFGKEILSPGDKVVFYLSEETIKKFSAPEKKRDEMTVDLVPDIIYEDEHIILVNKPPGMLSQRREPGDISVVEVIRSYLLRSGEITLAELRTFSPGICNRLDRNTSGILIAGKSLKGLQSMSRHLKERTVDKYYICVVQGRVESPCRLKAYLSKDRKKNIVMISDREGTHAIETEFVPLAWNKKFSLLKVHLMTGRPHQIRAHLSHMGHPIAGDMKYGSRIFNQWMRDTYDCRRQLLHSYELIFPSDMESVVASLSGKRFTAKIPEDFCRVIKEGQWQHGAQEALGVLH